MFKEAYTAAGALLQGRALVPQCRHLERPAHAAADHLSAGILARCSPSAPMPNPEEKDGWSIHPHLGLSYSNGAALLLRHLPNR